MSSIRGFKLSTLSGLANRTNVADKLEKYNGTWKKNVHQIWSTCFLPTEYVMNFTNKNLSLEERYISTNQLQKEHYLLHGDFIVRKRAQQKLQWGF